LKKEYWFVIITYIVMQVSSIFGVPLLMAIGVAMGVDPDAEFQAEAAAYWIVFSFVITLLLVLFFMRKDMKEDMQKVNSRNQASFPISLFWGIAGIFIALIAQTAAGMLEQLMGIETNSENTELILQLISQVPLVILVSSIIGPILEEIIFRKIIFGYFQKKFNFFLSALISSIIFGIAHFELEHLLLYSAMGFTFAYLYKTTNRIIVPIFAHVAMNTLVVLLQFYAKDMEQMVQVQNFIGGLL
jgi:membrane protease YdiL (CAAX protease family)